MIVNAVEEGWEIIFQRAHGLLAAKIADKLATGLRPDPTYWIETLTAIAEHDDGQQTWNGKNHVTDKGAPLDFSYHDPDLEQARKVVANGAYKSQWIALLTSMHTYYLYKPSAGKDQDVKIFLEEQEDYQKRLRRHLKMNKQEAEAAYTFMRWCDEFSLVLCRNQTPPQGRKLETGALPQDMPRFISAQENFYTVTPWCFEEDEFELFTEACYLPKLSYKNDNELLEQILNSKVQIKSWRFIKE